MLEGEMVLGHDVAFYQALLGAIGGTLGISVIRRHCAIKQEDLE